MSVRTVDNHLQRAYRKLGVARRSDLARGARRRRAEQSAAAGELSTRLLMSTARRRSDHPAMHNTNPSWSPSMAPPEHRARPWRAASCGPATACAPCVRHPDRADGCDPFAADLSSADDLARAYAGADVVVVQLPMAFDETAIVQAERVVEALGARRCARVVGDPGGPTAPVLVGVPYLDARTTLVQALEAGPFTAAIVEAAAPYMDNLCAPWSSPLVRDGVVAYPLPAEAPVPVGRDRRCRRPHRRRDRRRRAGTAADLRPAGAQRRADGRRARARDRASGALGDDRRRRVRRSDAPVHGRRDGRWVAGLYCRPRP